MPLRAQRNASKSSLVAVTRDISWPPSQVSSPRVTSDVVRASTCHRPPKSSQRRSTATTSSLSVVMASGRVGSSAARPDSDAAPARFRFQVGGDHVTPVAVGHALHEGLVESTHQRGVLAGQRVERAIGKPHVVLLHVRLEALAPEHLREGPPESDGVPRAAPPNARPSSRAHSCSAWSRDAFRAGSRHRGGQDVTDQVVATRGQ